jgi:hypothetical protein
MTKRRNAVAIRIHADLSVQSGLAAKGVALWMTPHVSAQPPHAC